LPPALVCGERDEAPTMSEEQMTTEIPRSLQERRRDSSARSLASTNAPIIRIISRIPAMLCWLNAWTADEIGLEIGKGQDEVRAFAQGSCRCLPR
jgi:hypothetical protein